jgi:hypothetical protein
MLWKKGSAPLVEWFVASRSRGIVCVSLRRRIFLELNMMIETHDRYRPGCTAALTNAVAKLPANHYQQGELEIYHFQQVVRAA